MYLYLQARARVAAPHVALFVSQPLGVAAPVHTVCASQLCLPVCRVCRGGTAGGAVRRYIFYSSLTFTFLPQCTSCLVLYYGKNALEAAPPLGGQEGSRL